ncbi:helix-turn-helix transcriptional regulator [Thermoactinospora rubra]|uniref:helix-turn-helix transcriptional regulator n=1 Tax=Thermoactinospora rubra TaxID=1088767 RepID=UPI001301F606|nr:LuxR family transcriptional regulator [Thermoactinospora rubra]
MSPHEAKSYLREQFEESAADAGRLVLISGGIASGKTTLLNELLDDAANLGALTLSATGAPDEQDIPAAVIDQLLTNCSASLDVRAPDHDDVQHVCDAILELARDRPTVICVDDIHFADEVSLKLLLQLQRRIRATKLLIVLSQQHWPHPARMRHGFSFARQPRYHAVHLLPMTEQAVRALMKDSDGDLPRQIHELSAGNPLLVRALIDDCRHSGEQLVVGASYVRALCAFLDRPDAHLLEVTTALAVLGEHGTGELIADLTGIDLDTVADILDVLTQGGLIRDGRFRHPSAEAAALRRLSPEARSSLHARAARLKHQAAAGALEVATHLVQAGQAPEWSISVLRRAADQALTVGEIAFATRCLELALPAATSEAERRAIRQAFMKSVWRANPSAVAPHIATLRETGALDQEECLSLIRHALWHGDKETAMRAHGLLSGSSEPLDPQTQVEVNLAVQWHFGPILPKTEEGEGEAHPCATPWNVTAETLLQTWERGGDEATNASAERILLNSRLSDTSLEAIVMAVSALARGGRADRAEWWCERLSDQARRRRAAAWQAMIDAVWAGVVLQRGDVAKAAELARASLDLLSDQNWGVSIGYPLSTLIFADIYQGDFDSATKTMRRVVPDAMFETIAGAWYLRACGHFHLATKRPLAAVGYFQKCQRLMQRWDAVSPTLVPWRSDLAEANLQLGNRAIARSLATQQMELSQEANPYAYGLALRVLAFAGPTTECAAMLGRAAKCFQDAGHQLELNRTLKAVAHLKNSQRREVQAAVPLAATRPRAVPAQAAPTTTVTALPTRSMPARAVPAHATPARAVPARKPAAPRREHPAPGESSVLSEAELRVAQLAALGHTNRQISDQLFITVSTVEQHLTRAYRKLGIKGRSALADELECLKISA